MYTGAKTLMALKKQNKKSHEIEWMKDIMNLKWFLGCVYLL